MQPNIKQNKPVKTNTLNRNKTDQPKTTKQYKTQHKSYKFHNTIKQSHKTTNIPNTIITHSNHSKQLTTPTANKQ